MKYIWEIRVKNSTVRPCGGQKKGLCIQVLSSLLLVYAACDCLSARTILFDACIDSQQKTEVRCDVGDGCVITGLGFRAHYDNITTMHVRCHRLTPDGRLTEPTEIAIGSEPNHACEAKIILPEGYVAVGFGAAGEPEWDVTLLRIWARPLRPDGTLGDIKVFNDGFKPEREPERHVLLTAPDRILTGAGLRFASNDIGGIYAASKRILNLAQNDQARLAAIATRAWSHEIAEIDNIDRLVDDVKTHGVNRIDLSFKTSQTGGPYKERLDAASKLCARVPGVKVYLALGTISPKQIPPLFEHSNGVAGITVRLSRSLSPGQVKDVINGIHEACVAASKELTLRLHGQEEPEILNIIKDAPREVGLIVPLDLLRQKHLDFGRRELIVELNLAPYSAPLAFLPDLRIGALPGCLVEAALAGARGFVVGITPSGHYLPDSVNGLALAALHQLADDPLQSTDDVRDRLFKAPYGAAAPKAFAALDRTAAINDLLFKTLGVEVLFDNGRILTMDEAEDRLNDYLESLGPGGNAATHPWLASDKRKIELADQEIDTAFWLLAQSIGDANEAFQADPCSRTSALLDAVLTLKSVADFWRDVTEAFMLTRVYRIDGAPGTRATIESALNGLRAPKQDRVRFDGTDAFIASVERNLAQYQNDALLVRALQKVRNLCDAGKDTQAAQVLHDILNSEEYTDHLSKQNPAISRIASSLRALGEVTGNLGVMRHGDGSWTVENVGGRWCYVIGPGRPCLYLDFLSGPLDTPAAYRLTFDYLDKGDWTIHFHYDSACPPGQEPEYHPVEPLRLTNTNAWKRGSFLLTNCRFASRQNALADMRFVAGSGACIRNIRLTPAPAKAADNPQ